MSLPRILRRAVPVALGGALAVALSTAPASADSGWWYSYGGGAKAYFTSYGDKTTVCDVKTDGYKGLAQILTVNGSLLYRVADDFNDGHCTSKSASYFNLQEGATYEIQVCVVRTGERPVDCSSTHRFTA